MIKINPENDQAQVVITGRLWDGGWFRGELLAVGANPAWVWL